MNALNLLLPDGTPSRVYACGECNTIKAQQSDADRCCTPIPCRFCKEPTDKKWGKHYGSDTYHDKCYSKDQHEKESARMDRAEKVESWDGWVWWDGHGGNNGYFESVEDFAEFLEDEYEDDEEWPEFVYVCKEIPFSGICLGHVLENLTDDMFEDATDHLVGVEELRAAIDTFNEANAGMISYEPNMKKAVRVPRPSEIES